MPGRGGEAYHCRTPFTGNPYITLANPTKLGFTHEIFYAWATFWFKLRSVIAWSGFVWIIRLGIIISIVAISKDRDMPPGHCLVLSRSLNSSTWLIYRRCGFCKKKLKISEISSVYSSTHQGLYGPNCSNPPPLVKKIRIIAQNPKPPPPFLMRIIVIIRL